MEKSGYKIRTPDQRLRVFISSTLRELADERKSAKASVERLGLIPVMFELGARPHPPKDLYQAYLFQSNIFIGIYWQSYGWIAENETISGIEDEYRLSGKHPRLIYVKEPANNREEKLNQLLDSIRTDGGVSYKSFSSADELEKLITDDLAILISERFFSTEYITEPADDVKTVHSNLPSQLPELLGRDKEMKALTELIKNNDRNLITLTGQGGIGKTKLSQTLAKSLEDYFDDGIYFIDLSDITDEKDIFGEIAASTGIHISKNEDPVKKLATFVSAQKILFILDNFEHLSSSTSKISSFYNKCPKLTIIITSRNSLNISIEKEFRISSLKIPSESDEFNEIEDSPAVKLFVSKAKAADFKFKLTEENAYAVSEICRILEGIPLAIELAAVKVRLFSPKMILERLNKKLVLLSGGSSDAPARHMTMISAIEWSIELLNEQEKIFYRRLAVFVNGFNYEAAENICGEGLDNVQDLTESLLSKNIINKKFEINESPRYIMPGLFHEYAVELFDQSVENEIIKLKFAHYFLEEAVRDVTGNSGKSTEFDSIKWGFDADNAIESADIFLKKKKYSELINLIYSIWQLFWIFDKESDLEKKINLMLLMHYADNLSDEDSGKLLWLAGASALAKNDQVTAEFLLKQAQNYFKTSGNKNGYAWSHHLITSIHAATHQEKSNEKILKSFEESARLFRESGDYWGECSVIQNLAMLEITLKHYSKAVKLLDEYEKLAKNKGNIAQQGYILIMKGLININLRKYRKALNFLKEGMIFFNDGKPPEAFCYLLLIVSYYFFKIKNDWEAMLISGILENLTAKFGFTPWDMLSSVTLYVNKKVSNSKNESLAEAYQTGLKAGMHKAIKMANETIQNAE